MTYKEKQYKRQVDVLGEHSEWFGGDTGNGIFKGKERKFALQDGVNNLFERIRPETEDNVVSYFKKNGISWWNGDGPTNHLCSSQIACLNHLFLLRHDKEAILAIAQAVDPEFDDVIEVSGDVYDPAYISFEVVSSRDYLNESKTGKLTRGSQCTSIDAVIIAVKDGKRILLPIEWKFVEEYAREDKSLGSHGEERRRRYFDSGLVVKSEQLKSVERPHGSIYFQEPYYQLMRQTLWAEQCIKNHDKVVNGAEDFIHVHVIPKENDSLRDIHFDEKWDNGQGMVSNWKAMLKHPEKYVCIDPKDLFKNIFENENLREKCKDLLEYLVARYWTLDK